MRERSIKMPKLTVYLMSCACVCRTVILVACECIVFTHVWHCQLKRFFVLHPCSRYVASNWKVYRTFSKSNRISSRYAARARVRIKVKESVYVVYFCVF